MIQVTLISVGTLKERYWRDALAEYEKRLSAFCKPNLITLKEAKLPENPSESEIQAALQDECERIIAAIPPKSFKIALCVEGKQFSSEALAEKTDAVLRENSSFCFIIGSSHGLDSKVKAAADLKLSVSELTFPHQMMRVMLLEIIYRSFNILRGTKYHK